MSHVPVDEEGGTIAMQESLEKTLDDYVGLQIEIDVPDVVGLETVTEGDRRNNFENMCDSMDVRPRAVKWHDSKPVTILSTFHNPKETTLVKRNNRNDSTIPVFCPKAIAEYNIIMGGDDHFDQRRECYTFGRRSVKWWHRLFYFLIDLGIVNAYIMWSHNKRGTYQLIFRLRLSQQLVARFSSRKKRGRPVFFSRNKRGVTGVPDDVHLQEVGKHLPVETNSKRRCQKCSSKQMEKRTKIVCGSCQVPPEKSLVFKIS
jgi:hypothetical protein